jgi:hypothetical protein
MKNMEKDKPTLRTFIAIAFFVFGVTGSLTLVRSETIGVRAIGIAR